MEILNHFIYGSGASVIRNAFPLNPCYSECYGYTINLFMVIFMNVTQLYSKGCLYLIYLKLPPLHIVVLI